jgi:hypothetical protein
MSSVLRALSQPLPNKRYTTEVGTAGRIYDIAGTNHVSVLAGTVLRDMGKTVALADGTLLRKVQYIPVVGGPASTPYEFRTGYIYLDNIPADQNIVAIN